MDTHLAELAELLARHSVASTEMQPTPVPGLAIFRADLPTTQTPGMYRPLFCLVASGKKQIFFAEETSRYRSGDCFVANVDVPVVGTVLEASSKRPYLALCIELRREILAALTVNEHGASRLADGSGLGLQGGPATADVVDVAVRLARLLDTPSHIESLAPLYERELLYRLSVGKWGELLKQAGLDQSRVSAVSRAIAWLQKHHAERFSAEELAGAVGGMSVATMNRYFREVLAMSPLQYQKRVRLLEAKRLLASRQADVSGAAYTVGYASPSQFNREYRQLFGASPGRDAIRG
jgi:AraC-like DNA-binding protein